MGPRGTAGVAAAAVGLAVRVENVRAGGSPATSDSTAVIGRRIAAALFDFVLLGVLFWVAGLAASAPSSGRSVQTGTAVTFVYLVIGLAYFCAAEAATGQTVGKRLLGIRVMRADGSRADLGRIAVRTLLRPIDAIGGYLVGLVSVLITTRRQRLGDLFADTVVVRARR